MKLLVVRLNILAWPTDPRGKTEGRKHSSYTFPPRSDLLFAFNVRTIVPYVRHLMPLNVIHTEWFIAFSPAARSSLCWVSSKGDLNGVRDHLGATGGDHGTTWKKYVATKQFTGRFTPQSARTRFVPYREKLSLPWNPRKFGKHFASHKTP